MIQTQRILVPFALALLAGAVVPARAATVQYQVLQISDPPATMVMPAESCRGAVYVYTDVSGTAPAGVPILKPGDAYRLDGIGSYYLLLQPEARTGAFDYTLNFIPILDGRPEDKRNLSNYQVHLSKASPTAKVVIDKQVWDPSSRKGKVETNASAVYTVVDGKLPAGSITPFLKIVNWKN